MSPKARDCVVAVLSGNSRFLTKYVEKSYIIQNSFEKGREKEAMSSSVKAHFYFSKCIYPAK